MRLGITFVAPTQRDHDFPRALHAWVVPETAPAMGGQVGCGARTERVQPAEGALVAVYMKDGGGVLGRSHVEDDKPMLRKANREYAPILLAPDEWTLWGSVTAIVPAPVQLTR